MRGMNVGPIIQSEVNQKEKKNCILTHTHIYIYMESRKIVLMIILAGQQTRWRHKEQTCGHGGGRRGWDDLRE